jgi:hypothetical protein
MPCSAMLCNIAPCCRRNATRGGCKHVEQYTWPGSNWRPSACEADVIATRPQVLLLRKLAMVHQSQLIKWVMSLPSAPMAPAVPF